MRERLIALRERRAVLVGRASAERDALQGWLARTDRLSAWIATGSSLLAELKREPRWIAGAAVILIAARPRPMLRLIMRLWGYWQFVLRARILWHRYGPAASRLQ